MNPREPGALFGLGWLLYKKPDYRDAIAQYAAVTAITVWVPGDRQKFLEDAYFNQACSYSLMASINPGDAAYVSAMTCLEEAKKVAMEFNYLPDWKTKIEKEASKDLKKLQQAKAQELASLLA